MKQLITLALGLTLFICSAQPVIADDINGIVASPTIVRILGSVKVFRQNRFERAYPGMKLKQGDEIRTGRRGRAYIDFPDNSRVKLGIRSRFLVRDWSEKEGVFYFHAAYFPRCIPLHRRSVNQWYDCSQNIFKHTHRRAWRTRHRFLGSRG